MRSDWVWSASLINFLTVSLWNFAHFFVQKNLNNIHVLVVFTFSFTENCTPSGQSTIRIQGFIFTASFCTTALLFWFKCSKSYLLESSELEKGFDNSPWLCISDHSGRLEACMRVGQKVMINLLCKNKATLTHRVLADILQYVQMKYSRTPLIGYF